MYTPVPTRHMYMYINIKNLVNSTRYHEGFFRYLFLSVLSSVFRMYNSTTKQCIWSSFSIQSATYC